MTLCCVYNDTHVLLGEIVKEGKLKGMYNGFGGKVEKGETIEDAAKRELLEECGITPLNMRERGTIIFKFDPEGNPFEGKPIVELHVFSVTKFKGELTQSREMRPQWFLHKDIPYAKMWPDDIHWLPLLLKGKNFEGIFHLKDPKTITKYKLEEM